MIPRFLWPRALSSVIPWVAGGFLVGVLAHAGSPFARVDSFIVSTTAVVAIGFILFMPRAWRIGLTAVLVGLFIGFFRFDLTIPTKNPQVPFEGMVVGVGKYDVRIRDSASGISVKHASTRYRLGERVRVACKELVPLDTQETYASFDARRGVWFHCAGASVIRQGQGHGWNAHQALLRWRQTLTWRIQRLLPGDAGALLSGILYGERTLSADASATFRSAGMTHLIAVSGSNIALVASLFVPFFLAIGYRRKPSIVLAGVAIIAFVLFVGAEASVVRAAIMGWLALLARVFGRKASAGRLLIVAATIIVFFDPWALAFDAGFALSFLATGGLLSWARPFQERCTWIPTWFGLREAFATTLAATIVTTPYSLWAFGQVSLAGLLTNLLAIPLVGLAMLWGAVALIIGTIIPWFTLPAQGALEAILLISRLAELLPWLHVSFMVPTWGLFLLYAWLWWHAMRKKGVDIFYPHPDVFEVNYAGLLTTSVRNR